MVILPRFDSSRTSHPNVTKAGTEVSAAKGDLYTDGARMMPGPVDINDVFAWEKAARYRAATGSLGKADG
ncbi:MAG TPA: hypothetical protein VFD97_08735 [Acidimicrobiia bacterium]|nr:hypothetical protein [Acidimicrobiia bacterium]